MKKINKVYAMVYIYIYIYILTILSDKRDQ